MTIDLYILLCVIFIAATWIYFLKCEIHELRRRAADTSGGEAYSTMSEATSSDTHHAPVLVPSRVASGKRHASAPVHAHAGGVAAGQHGGIPVWTIE